MCHGKVAAVSTTSFVSQVADPVQGVDTLAWALPSRWGNIQMGMLGAQLFRLSVLYRDEPSPVLTVEYSSTFMDQLKAKASSKCFCFKGSLVKKWVKWNPCIKHIHIKECAMCVSLRAGHCMGGQRQAVKSTVSALLEWPFLDERGRGQSAKHILRTVGSIQKERIVE